MLMVLICLMVGASVTMATTQKCTRFKPSSQTHLYILQAKKVYNHLDYVFLKCKTNYFRVGPGVRRCVNGSWVGNIPRCFIKHKVIVCPRLHKIAHGTVRGSNRVNSIRTFRCYKKYIRIGTRTQKCLANQTWSGVIPRCITDITCPNPGIPKNGFRFGNSFKNSRTVKFGCNNNYKLVGSEYRQCMSNRKWSGKLSKCQKIDPLQELKKVAENLRKNVVDKFSLVTTDSRARSGITSSGSGLDFVFVLDYSHSVGLANFKRGVKFMQKIIEKLGVSSDPQGTRVAILTFHSKVKICYNLQTNAIKDINETMKALGALQFAGGGTDIAKALKKVYDVVRPETRVDAKKVLFLITDGHSNVDSNPQTVAAQLREKGFEIFTIGITTSANDKELKRIASQPYRSHMYLIDTYLTLEKLVDMLTEEGTDKWECGDAGDTGLRTRLKTPNRKKSKDDTWPWQAAIYVEGKFYCGGTLIAEKWVLTSTKCFDKKRINDLNNYHVVVTLGNFDRAVGEGTEQDVKVVKIFRPKKYAKGSRDDLALLKLEYVKMSVFVRPICLDENPDSSLIWPTQYGVITGWGSTKLPRKQPIPVNDEVHQAVVKFVSLNYCKQNTKFNLKGNVFCGRSEDNTVAECLGDTGGSVMARSQDDSWMLVGVMKYNEGCSADHKYSVFTKVGYNSKWIAETISNNP